jgi:hypothetical protein
MEQTKEEREAEQKSIDYDKNMFFKLHESDWVKHEAKYGREKTEAARKQYERHQMSRR